MDFLEHTFTFLMILTTCSLPENGLFGKYRIKSLISEIERFLLFLNLDSKIFMSELDGYAVESGAQESSTGWSGTKRRCFRANFSETEVSRIFSESVKINNFKDFHSI